MEKNVLFKDLGSYGGINSLNVGDEPLDKNCVYDAVFVTVQGVPANYGKDRKNLDVHAVDVLEQYVEK